MRWLALLGVAQVAAIDPQQAAREHYRRGLEHYDAGQFDRAIEEFQQAYDVSAAPELLFNLAQAHRLRRNWERALSFYQAYLRGAPDASNRADVAARIEEMKRKLAVAAAVKKPRAPAAPVPRPLLEPAAAHDADAHAGAGLKVAGIITGAGGLALVGVGVYYGLRADRISALAAENHATACWIVGGMAMAGGGVLYWLGVREERMHVAAAPLPGGGGVVVSGHFR